MVSAGVINAVLTFKLAASVIGNVVLFAVMLLVPAGTLAWWRAWVLVGVVAVACSMTMFLIFRDNEALLDERFKSPMQPGQPLADKIIIAMMVPAFAGFMVFIPLDVFRFRLIDKPDALVSSAGLVLFVAGWTIMSLSFRENAFAAPVVKHQAERGQRVIDSGVYSVVRHPMYAGAIVLMAGAALWLESYAGAVLTVVPAGILAVRSAFEEKFLAQELEGYGTYAEKVRYRLIPFVW